MFLPVSWHVMPCPILMVVYLLFIRPLNSPLAKLYIPMPSTILRQACISCITRLRFLESCGIHEPARIDAKITRLVKFAQFIYSIPLLQKITLHKWLQLLQLVEFPCNLDKDFSHASSAQATPRIPTTVGYLGRAFAGPKQGTDTQRVSCPTRISRLADVTSQKEYGLSSSAGYIAP